MSPKNFDISNINYHSYCLFSCVFSVHVLGSYMVASCLQIVYEVIYLQVYDSQGIYWCSRMSVNYYCRHVNYHIAIWLHTGPYAGGVRGGSTWSPYFCSLKLMLSLSTKININLICCASCYSYSTCQQWMDSPPSSSRIIYPSRMNIIIINIFYGRCLIYYGI